MGKIKHFAATTFIVHQGKVLLHLHKKLNIWLPVGGHVDENELPHEAALREIREESGLEARLFDPRPRLEMGDVADLPCPFHILLENINDDHQHIDLIYYATSETDILSPKNEETAELRWLALDEIEALENTPANVKVLAAEIINLLKQNASEN